MSQLHIDKCYKEGHDLNKDQNKLTWFLRSRILSRNVSETLICKRGFIQANRPDGPRWCGHRIIPSNRYRRCGRGGKFEPESITQMDARPNPRIHINAMIVKGVIELEAIMYIRTTECSSKITLYKMWWIMIFLLLHNLIVC